MIAIEDEGRDRTAAKNLRQTRAADIALDSGADGLGFRAFAFADVCIDGDKAAVGEGCTTNLEHFPVRSRALEDMRSHVVRPFAGFLCLHIGVSRSVFAALRVEEHQGME
ncbi:MAG: hypothetical protein Q8L44_10455 [Sulfuritalea sp.]|nr:hypothetical protein [Sulfuritalea sp.]